MEFVLKFNEFGVYHSDLKTHNTVVIFDEWSKVVIRVIDLGGASLNYKTIEAYTAKFMPKIAKLVEDNKKPILF